MKVDYTKKQPLRSRSWFLTIYLDVDLYEKCSKGYKVYKPTIKEWDYPQYLPPHCTYMAGQLEQGPKSGKWHYHIFLYFSQPKSMGLVKDYMKANWAKCIIPMYHDQCIDYCMKEESRVSGPWQLGSRPEQGARTDILMVKEAITAGVSLDEIRNSNLYTETYVKYHSGLDKIYLAHQHKQPRRRRPEVYIYWGVSGAGKTYRAELEAGEDVYIKGCDEKWWDGYEGQENVIIEEFDLRNWKQHGVNQKFLNMLLDKQQCYVPCRYGKRQFKATKIWICSNENPEYWYERGTEFQLLRRVKDVVYFDQVYDDNLRTKTWAGTTKLASEYFNRIKEEEEETEVIVID